MSTWALLRLSLVRFGASLMVVLTTGVVNRIFIGDLGYSEAWFTLLLCLQQLVTPLTLVTSYWSDAWPLFGRRRVPYIVLWSVASALGLALMMLLLRRADEHATHTALLFALAAGAMSVFGLGVKASNLVVTALLVDRLPQRKRTGALTFIWIMAIAGLVAGGLIYARVFAGMKTVDLAYLNRVTLWTAAAMIVMTLLGVIGVEPRNNQPRRQISYAFGQGLRIVAGNPHARWFFGFMALAEFSFFCQDLILEVYGAQVFDLSVSATTQYNFYQGLGTLMGMALGWTMHEAMWMRNRVWQLPIACLVGAGAFAMLAASAAIEQSWLATAAILLLGVAKGGYNAALAGALMELIDRRLVGILLGTWGTMSGIAIAAGMFAGGAMRQLLFNAAMWAQLPHSIALRGSFAGVFALEMAGLLVAATMLLRFQPAAYREHLDREFQLVNS